MRRGVGVGAVQRKSQDLTAFSKVGEISKEQKIKHVKQALERFKSSIETFAAKHKNRINEDPTFRHQFHKMCNSMKVDPLASNKGKIVSLS